MVAGFSSARAINDLGDVVGSSATSRVIGSHNGVPTYATDAFLWHDGRMTDLGSLPGGENSGNVAVDINDRGQIAGVVSDAQGAHAATWRGGRWTALDPLAPGDQMGAIAINDLGQVAGSDDNRAIAVLWTAGAPEDVTASGRCPGLGPFDLAFDVNDLGWLLAWANDPARPTPFGGSYRSPVICRAGTLQFLPAPPSASDVSPSRMSKLGAIVGTANLLDAAGTFSASRAVLWIPGLAH